MIPRTYRKTSHAKSKEDGQGWQEATVNDTLNIYDNGETRTPTLVVFENHSQDTRYNPLGDVCQTVSATYGMGGNNQPLVVGGVDMENKNQHKAVVRRLTPLECNRLQGFPEIIEDGNVVSWVDIGEWTDEKGKLHKDADSPKYKALGNSIGLPFWQWLADKIVGQLKKDGVEKPTMASLFDGIGGFPLVFKRAGCEPLFNSEIESFPEAVTTKHFGDEDKGIEGDLEKFL